MADERTIAVYNAKAGDYARMVDSGGPDQTLRDFIAALPEGARVLDLGCGPGAASAHMQAAGLAPDPVDASAEMVALARERHGLAARLATFDDLDAIALYDGVWANFSLLHAPRADLPRHIAAISRALRPGGLFHIGMKTGAGEARDPIGRFYTYVTIPELRALLEGAGFQIFRETTGKDRGLAGTLDPYVILQAGKQA